MGANKGVVKRGEGLAGSEPAGLLPGFPEGRVTAVVVVVAAAEVVGVAPQPAAVRARAARCTKAKSVLPGLAPPAAVSRNTHPCWAATTSTWLINNTDIHKR
jgi:hypothetical protein